MLSVRFLQFSELLFPDALQELLGFLPPEKIATIQAESGRVIREIVNIALEREVDALICPGGLWQDDLVTASEASDFHESFAQLHPVPVIISPGLADPYHRFSFHDPIYLRRKTGVARSRNIEVFSRPELERRTMAALPDVDFYGCSAAPGTTTTPARLVRPDAYSVYVGGNADRWGIDFNLAIRPEDARVPLLRYADEPLPQVLLREAAKGAEGEPERIGLNTRAIHRLELDITGKATVEELASLLLDKLDAEEVDALDIVLLRLKGVISPCLEPIHLSAAMPAGRCLHLDVDDADLQPDLLQLGAVSGPLAAKRVMGQFAGRAQATLTEAENLSESALAVFMGFDAIEGREVSISRVD